LGDDADPSADLEHGELGLVHAFEPVRYPRAVQHVGDAAAHSVHQRIAVLDDDQRQAVATGAKGRRRSGCPSPAADSRHRLSTKSRQASAFVAGARFRLADTELGAAIGHYSERFDIPTKLASEGSPAGVTPLEQCQEKHVPDIDPGWKPVFRPTLRQGTQLDQSSIPRSRTLI
jgi:hypothetical protein